MSQSQVANNQKPKRSIRVPAAGIPNRVRVVRLSFTNLLMIAVAVIAVFFLLGSAMQPSLGKEVSVSEFLRNTKDNHYARIDIRNDGNAVAYGKYLDFVQFAQSPKLDGSTNTGKLQIVEESNMERKSVKDVVELFAQPKSINETLEQLRRSLGADRVREIYVLDDRIVVDWESSNSKDWLITDVSEAEFKSELAANKIDIASLPVLVSYLRTAGTSIQSGDFESAIASGKYAQVWVFGDRLYARVPRENNVQNYVNFGTTTADFTKMLQAEGISLASQSVEFAPLPISQIDFISIVNLIFIAMLGFLGYMLLRSINGSNGGLMKFGQTKARMFFGQKMTIRFADVAGVDEAKNELQEVVDFLKNPNKYIKLGAKIPRGVLMVGEPGTGKTLLARAVAGEAGVPFFHTSGSEFEEMLVGAGASRVRDLFDKAKKASPALIFIDEIDAVGRKRGTTIQSSSTEQTLNQILVEMDGFEPRDNVIVIAATNRPDVLDPALLRPGRFDRKVVLDAPDIDGRVAILKIHAQNKPLSESVDLRKVSRRTVGFSGADLANMLNEAAIIVAKENRKEITMQDIEEAATKVQTGPVRRRNRTQEELRMTAYHEAAHAIVMKLTPQSDPVHRITILSRGMALGYTMPLPENDQLQMTKTKMESKIRSLLAGWTAEEMIFNDVTTGASNDIERATVIAQRMVKEFGMSQKLGLIKYGNVEEQPHMGWGYADKSYSEATAEMIDDEVRRIVNEAHADTQRILTENRALLEQISEDLIKKEVLEGEEFEKYFDKV